MDERQKFETENELKHLLSEKEELEHKLVSADEESAPREELIKFHNEHDKEIENLREKLDN